MDNYYTVANAASRMNCSPNLIRKMVKDGRFTDAVDMAGYQGRPALMIPSDQVEAYVSNGNFKKHKSRNNVTAVKINKPVVQEETPDVEPKKQNKISSRERRKMERLSRFENRNASEIDKPLESEVKKTYEPVRTSDGKITITLDADLIKSSVDDSFRKRIGNLRIAFDLVNEELKALEQALN